MKKCILGITLAVVSFVCVGCETIAGLGRDLENTGTVITDTVDKF